MKKFLSILLCAVLLIPAAIFAADATSSTPPEVTIPQIVVHGTSNTYYDSPDGPVAIYDDGDYISKLIPDGIPLIAKGILTGQWSDWCELFLKTMEPAYEHYAPNLDGTMPEGSHPEVEGLHSDGRIWHFTPDERKSPVDVAADLARAADTVRAATGQEKLTIIGRCEGSAYALAYMYLYERPRDYSGIHAFIMSDPAVYGVHYAEAIYSGSVYIDAFDAANFLRSDSTLGNLIKSPETIDTIQQVVDVLKNTYGIEITASLLNRMYRQLKDPLFAPFLRMYYARGLGAWSAVYHRFDKAVEYLFPTDELKTEYAFFIDKATQFHEIAEMIPDVVAGMKANGVIFADIVEYGYPMYPLSEDASEVGDTLTGVRYKAFGAESSRMDGTLKKSYVEERTAAGYGKYISPDKQIDASTGLFPDNTWFVKNLNHAIPQQIYNFYTSISECRLADVFTDENYPQFLRYDENLPTLVPAQPTDAPAEQIEYSFIEKVKLFIRNIIQKFRELFEKIRLF